MLTRFSRSLLKSPFRTAIASKPSQSSLLYNLQQQQQKQKQQDPFYIYTKSPNACVQTQNCESSQSAQSKSYHDIDYNTANFHEFYNTMPHIHQQIGIDGEKRWRYVDLVHPHVAEFADLF
ncbi:hypothetical protein KGF56_003247 [Candida oxycetoniae]|uniref:Uncharacterized protein n=1 Tax=Candida oxycetoniae TaxID=497107 RepID=A0AAI9SWS3_9ASCO|nr:uncharacterized protein KGF56_003247 [Candida oxycetoniae]KAI3403980.2 hypothetical protein KGF56_003247 [Candida oxycetoniae]